MEGSHKKLAKHPGAHRVDLSDDEDSVIGEDAITKEEIQQQDHETLTGEEEAERLLGGVNQHGDDMRSVRRPRHRNQRRLEEGNRSSSGASSVTSSQEDKRRTMTEKVQERKVCRYHNGRTTVILAELQLMFHRAKSQSVDDLRHCIS